MAVHHVDVNQIRAAALRRGHRVAEPREIGRETLSYTDALTGLPNRRLLADRAEVALAAAKRDGTPFAVLFLNLDRFNHINETLGRAFGDRVLLDVAERIKVACALWTRSRASAATSSSCSRTRPTTAAPTPPRRDCSKR